MRFSLCLFFHVKSECCYVLPNWRYDRGIKYQSDPYFRTTLVCEHGALALRVTTPMAIYAMHGIFEEGNPKAFLNRSFMHALEFVELLKRLPFKFVNLESAIAGEKHALTIDDATKAAYDAAVVAKRLGHEVTVFVNPFFIEHELPYFFVRLNSFLDQTRLPAVEWKGASYPLTLRSERRLLRAAIKHGLSLLRSIEEINALIDEAKVSLCIENDVIPSRAQTATREHLRHLLELGVKIENHGFSHLNPKALIWPQMLSEIEVGRQWIEDRCKFQSKFFAAPFGDCIPQRQLPPQYGRYWLMLHDQLFSGQVGTDIWNRLSFETLVANHNPQKCNMQFTSSRIL